ncbi:MAG: DUF262 domain-containing protein [Nitrospirota bacterium]|nr:DUF262 domain-containing protein [Nitrospirota bacterium]
MDRFDVDREPIYHLFTLYKAGRINLQPNYQRSRVWSNDLRYALIDSIRQEFPIGLIMFNVSSHVDEDGLKSERYDVVDGQQRMRTILEYIDGFEWAAKAKSDEDFQPFGDLTGTQQDRIKEYKLPVAKMKDFDQEEIIECFNRLQKGKPLKIGEKLKSLTVSKIHRYVQQVTEHKIFASDPRLKIRDAHWTLATAFLMAVYSNNLFRRQEYKQLEEFLKASASPQKASKATEQCKKILNYESKVLDEALQLDLNFSRYSQTARTLKWLFVALATLLRTYSISGREHRVAQGVLNYYKLIQQEGSEEWINYLNTGRTGRIDTREVRDCILQLTNQIVLAAKVEPLDSQRFFTAEQRREIYKQSDGICQSCSIPLSPTNYHADHMKPHRAGGKTIAANGRALCTKCNREKGGTWKDLFPVELTESEPAEL